MQYVNDIHKRKSALLIIEASRRVGQSTQPRCTSEILSISRGRRFLDIGEDVAGEDAHADHGREVTAVTAAFALQMEGVILLQVWNICV